MSICCFVICGFSKLNHETSNLNTRLRRAPSISITSTHCIRHPTFSSRQRRPQKCINRPFLHRYGRFPLPCSSTLLRNGWLIQRSYQRQLTTPKTSSFRDEYSLHHPALLRYLQTSMTGWRGLYRDAGGGGSPKMMATSWEASRIPDKPQF